METTLNAKFRDLIYENECESNPHVVLRLSDADGVRSGKSGYSFGISQFDTQNNPLALELLRKCGFTEQEIQMVVHQSMAIDLKSLNAKLAAHADVIAEYDTKQLSYCLNLALNAETSHGVPLADNNAILASADYCNQYGSIGDGMITYLKGLGRPVVALDILNWKLEHTKYGREHASDCRRRYDNLLKLAA